MKSFTITITLLVALCMGDTMDTSLFGLNLRKEIKVTDLLTAWGISDTKVEKLGETNMIYKKNNLICYLLIDVLYSIEIKEGKYGHLEIGMKKREILKKLGKTDIQTFPNKEILEYDYDENINYIITLELKTEKYSRQWCGVNKILNFEKTPHLLKIIINRKI